MRPLIYLAIALLFDVRADPVNPVSWGSLVLLLVIAFVLAMSFMAGLVFLLIWHKRRKISSSEQAKPSPHIQHLTGAE